MTDEEFNTFLRSNDKKVLLLELKYWDGDSEETLYVSDKGYNTNLSPGVEHRLYPAVIKKVPSNKQSLVSNLRSSGEVVFNNIDGELDIWITDYKFDGREAVFLYGSPDWLYAEFRQVSVSIVESRTARQRDQVVLKLRDPEVYLDQPIQTALVATGPNTGDYEPIAYGQINNASAVLLDGTTHKYKISDIAIDSITTVKDQQVNVAGYTADIANGEFTLNAQPNGKVTVDFKGAKVGGTLLEKAGDIIDHIITTRTNLPGALYDAAAFTALDVDITWKHNLYVPENATARQVINRILDSIGAKLIRTRDGKIGIARLKAPAVTEILEIGSDDIKRKSLKPVKIEPPWIRARLGYAKNYTVQSSLDTTITEAVRAAAEREFDIVSDSNAIAAAHPLAIEPDLIETTLTLQADATSRLTELMLLRAVERFVYECQAYSIAYVLSVGETVKLINQRFGLAAGTNALIYLQDDAPTRGKSKVQLWL